MDVGTCSRGAEMNLSAGPITFDMSGKLIMSFHDDRILPAIHIRDAGDLRGVQLWLYVYNSEDTERVQRAVAAFNAEMQCKETKESAE